MNIKEMRILFITLYIFCILAILYPSITYFIERDQEKFISLIMLDENELMQKYFSDNKTITLDEKINWNIYLKNEMNELIYVDLKIKIVNGNIQGPNIDLLLPTQSEEIINIYKILLNSEEIIIPFSWTIVEIEPMGDGYIIKKIMINDHDIKTNIDLTGNLYSKIIVEVWKYNTESQEFSFIIDNGVEKMCVWSQINFKLEN